MKDPERCVVQLVAYGGGGRKEEMCEEVRSVRSKWRSKRKVGEVEEEVEEEGG